MSKELIIVIGLPYSGRTTWINKKYTEENTFVLEESTYEKFYKDGKVQESEFYNSLDWVTAQITKLMEGSIEQIVFLPYQCRPDRWIDILKLAKTHEYKITFVKPTNGSLYYSSSKLGTSREQISWIQKSTINRFPKFSKEKKKVGEDEEEKENFNLYNNIVLEFQSAQAFLLQNRGNITDLDKLILLIENQFKPAMLRIQQTKANIVAKQIKDAEKIAKQAKDAEDKAAKEAAREEVKAARIAKLAEQNALITELATELATELKTELETELEIEQNKVFVQA